jgi:hypothetical protein
MVLWMIDLLRLVEAPATTLPYNDPSFIPRAREEQMLPSEHPRAREGFVSCGRLLHTIRAEKSTYAHLKATAKELSTVPELRRVLSNAGWANNHLHLSTSPVLHIGRIDAKEQIRYKLTLRGPATRNQGAERLDRGRFWLRDP